MVGIMPFQIGNGAETWRCFGTKNDSASSHRCCRQSDKDDDILNKIWSDRVMLPHLRNPINMETL
eukprot:3332382-Prorocentrum_lima.AAC.1